MLRKWHRVGARGEHSEQKRIQFWLICYTFFIFTLQRNNHKLFQPINQTNQLNWFRFSIEYFHIFLFAVSLSICEQIFFMSYIFRWTQYYVILIIIAQQQFSFVRTKFNWNNLDNKSNLWTLKNHKEWI